MQNIIVTDDGTKVSDRALEVACEIAKACDATMTLLHVIERIEDPDTMLFRNNPELIEKAKLMKLGPSSQKKRLAKTSTEKDSEAKRTKHKI